MIKKNPTETIRIAVMSEDERTIINALSREERKEALLKAGQTKIQKLLSRAVTVTMDGGGYCNAPLPKDGES